MKIYLATNNNNKKREMAELFPDHQIVTPKDENIEFDPEETGSTFYENSLIKAKALWEIVHAPVIADDSGICVQALNGLPGIYSSRYAGPGFETGKPDGSRISQAEQNKFLIQQTNEALATGTLDTKNIHVFPQGERSAHYVCAMVLYLGPERLYVAQETMEGSLIDNINDSRGEGGFGYDPIFYLPDYKKTSAEITAEEKNAISHRGKAARIIKKIIDDIL
jgi:XTP/dITP diphosphohydrolase